MSVQEAIRVERVELPARVLLVKRGKLATEYFGYCEELGCGVWDELLALKARVGEPECLWLPEALRPEGSSTYVMGVAIPEGHREPIMQGFDLQRLPAGSYLRFQGAPYDDRDFEQAIGSVQAFMAGFDPQSLGLNWDDSLPRIQLEPRGERGYIELRAVKPLA